MSGRKRRSRTRLGPALVVGLVAELPACSTRERTRDPTTTSNVQSAMSTPPQNASPWCPDELVQARRGGSDADRYVVPSVEERRRMSDLVEGLGRSGSSELPAARVQATRLGFELTALAGGVFVLRERDELRRGGGAYLFRLGSTSRLVVQAPHTFFDEGTFPLSCELFARTSAFALFIDTAHRYKAAEIDEDGQHPADVAHATDSHFQAATEGLLRGRGSVTVVQLHGFSPRESGAGIVLSSGVAEKDGPLVLRAAALLRPEVEEKVLRFPDEASELGATTNAQGKAVRAAGGAFLHVEMSSPLRKRLLANADLRARVLQALARGALSP